MYSNKFIATIKCSNKILREQGNEIIVPFGNEYSIFLKNLESRKALVKITIDGKDIGSSLIVDAGRSMCIERFITNNEQGNRFKFINKTEDIIRHRGDRIDDGIIKVEFTFEQEKPNVIYHTTIHHDYSYPYYYYPSYPDRRRYFNDGNMSISNNRRHNSFSEGVTYNNSNNITYKAAYTSNVSSRCSESSLNSLPSKINANEGITVKGSPSFQKFIGDTIGNLEENTYSIVLILKGYNRKEQIATKPILVREKLQCETCGKTSKSDAHYCKFCGTFLV